MPAKTERQRKAAGAELARRRAGKKARLFKSMGIEDLRKMARKVGELHYHHMSAKLPMDVEEARRMMMAEANLHMMGNDEE